MMFTSIIKSRQTGFALTLVLSLLAGSVCSQPDRINHRGQDLFFSGSNVAWRSFANDAGRGNTDFDWFQNMINRVSEDGGNSLRWWLHTNGANNPEFDGDGRVSGLHDSHISDMRRVLDMAEERNVVFCICLWSFDMLRISFGDRVTDRARRMLTDESYLQSYIDNALIPMVEALRGHRAILAWEIFNEAEGMSHEHGWDMTHHVSMADIQRFTNRCAGAIRRADPGTKVTTGCWSFLANTDVDGHTNYYADERLIEAGGDEDGYLDFYQVHYYDWGGTAISPFHHPASYWELDKPILIGEFFARETFGVERDELYNNLYENGYAGAWNWTYASDWDNARWNAQFIRDNYPDDVTIDLSREWTVTATRPAAEAVPILKYLKGRLFLGAPSWYNREMRTMDMKGRLVPATARNMICVIQGK
jgi:hypothetical protein